MLKAKHTVNNPVKVRGCFKKDFEPDWITGGSLGTYPIKAEDTDETIHELKGSCVQQDDLLKPLFEDIIHYGLNYAYT